MTATQRLCRVILSAAVAATLLVGFAAVVDELGERRWQEQAPGEDERALLPEFYANSPRSIVEMFPRPR